MSTDDDRKADEAWLLARETAEAGTEVPPPSDETRRAYDALAAELAQLPAPGAPAGWRDRMLAALDEPVAEPAAEPVAEPTTATTTPRSRPRRWWLLAGPLAAAAAALLVWQLVGDRREPIALHVEVRAGEVVRRAGEAPAVGDVFVARVLLPRAGELRLYRNDSALLARCPGHKVACTTRRVGDRDELTLEMPMTSKGAYRALVIDGAVDLKLTGSLDDDFRDARDRGLRVLASDSISAR